MNRTSAKLHSSLSLLPIIICILISACSTTHPQKPLNHTLSWDERQQQLTQLQHWDVNGKVAIRSAQANGTASVNWQQKNQQYHIRLFGPLGAGLVQLDGNPSEVTMRLSKQEVYQAQTPEALLLQYVGWNMPVSNLPYWLRGLPAPGASAQKSFDAYHHISRLQQQDWTVRYLSYTSVRGIDLPSKIEIDHPDVKITFVVNKWSL